MRVDDEREGETEERADSPCHTGVTAPAGKSRAPAFGYTGRLVALGLAAPWAAPESTAPLEWRQPGERKALARRATALGVNGVRLLAVPAAVARRLSVRAVADAAAYVEADAAVVVGDRDVRATATVRTALDRTLAPAADGQPAWLALAADADPAPDPPAADTPALCAVPAPAALEDALAGVSRTAPTLAVCPALAVTHDPASLSSSLPGADRFGRLAARLDGSLALLAGGQPAGYAHDWAVGDATVTAHGLGATADPHLAAVAVGPDGRVATERLDPDSFGLRAVAGVGPATAERLREAGFERRADLAAASDADLAALPGVGEATARRMRRHVDVVESGDPLRTTNAALPGRDASPVCLDVETDGLTPTIVWQFGLYDPRADEYVAVLEDEDPTDPGPVVREFCETFFGRYADRPVLSWNGDEFDFPTVERFVRRHAPDYASAWADVWTVDLLAWARDHALLPGRTNRLDDVARAVGHDPAGTGLSGARTAAAYRAFRAAPAEPAAEPDWERHRAYCEDDCRALWRVYEALAGAERRTPSAADGDRQTGLGDFA